MWNLLKAILRFLKRLVMGSMPVHSILKGPTKSLSYNWEPTRLHRIFEKVVEELEEMRTDSRKTIERSEKIRGIRIHSNMLQNMALIYRNQTISYSELNHLANKLARAMLATIAGSEEGVKPNGDGDLIVAVCLPPSNLLIVTLLACWKMGAAYLPIDPTFPASRIEHILRESEPRLVVAHETDMHLFGKERVVSVEELQKQAADLEEGNLPELEEGKDVPQIAIVLYTSGSTGVPKGVRLSHSAVLNRLKWQWFTFPYSQTEKVGIFKTALTFVDSVSEIWGPLLNARTLLVVSKEDSKDAERIMGFLEQYEVERLVLVPTLLRSILAYVSSQQKKEAEGQNKPLDHLRLWVCSGETLPPSLVHEFYRHFDVDQHKLCNFYGSTEVMGDVTYYVIDKPDDLPPGNVPIGTPVYNSAVYLLDDKLNPVNLGETGEIYVSGLNLASGYVRNRDPDRFIDNNILVDSGHRKLFRTGDFGRIEKNTLHFEGRKDSQVKVRGHRVDLSEIEAALKNLQYIQEAVVLVHNAGESDQALVAFVVFSGCKKGRITEEELKQILPSYMVPYVMPVESIPLLVNGKVDRQSLLALYRNQTLSHLDFEKIIDFKGVAEENLVKARAVFETAVDVLGKSLRSKISAESNFFSLGGNSLNAVYFVTKLRDLGYAISVTDFLKAPTFNDVINKVTSERDSVKLVDDVAAKELEQKYKIELVSEETKNDFIEILCTSFYEKADLENYMEPRVPYNDYLEVITAIWPSIFQEELSFIVRDSSGKVVGAAMNKDAYQDTDDDDLPENSLATVLDFLDGLEKKALEKLPKGKGKIFHNFMMGSRNYISTQDTVELFIFMEDEIMKLAKSLGFEGVFTSNTSPLTQQLGTSVNKYQTLLECQANQYTAPDGTKPFEKGPDTLKVIVCWKPIKRESDHELVASASSHLSESEPEVEKLVESLSERESHEKLEVSLPPISEAERSMSETEAEAEKPVESLRDRESQEKLEASLPYKSESERSMSETEAEAKKSVESLSDRESQEKLEASRPYKSESEHSVSETEAKAEKPKESLSDREFQCPLRHSMSETEIEAENPVDSLSDRESHEKLEVSLPPISESEHSMSETEAKAKKSVESLSDRESQEKLEASRPYKSESEHSVSETEAKAEKPKESLSDREFQCPLRHSMSETEIEAENPVDSLSDRESQEKLEVSILPVSESEQSVSETEAEVEKPAARGIRDSLEKIEVSLSHKPQSERLVSGPVLGDHLATTPAVPHRLSLPVASVPAIVKPDISKFLASEVDEDQDSYADENADTT